MPILSLEFALFVLVALLIYYLLPGRLQNPFLLLASLFYYLTWSWSYTLILLVLATFNYYYAPILDRRQADRRRFLWLGIGLNSAVLLIFLLNPYYGPLLARRLAVFNIETSLLLPLGMSYYILQCISYLADIALKIAKPASNWTDFTLHLVYFPRLVSGPIERARKFLPLLASQRVVDNIQVTRSLMLILLGLTRSVILAGLLSVLTPAAWLGQPQDSSAGQLLMGLLAFLFFLYNQFNGYTNLVCGVSGLFGIELTRNFQYPFFSQDFSDFWKRWHISLSQWLRDYIYMPLSRSLLRRNPSRTNLPNLILPPLVTMLVSGVWHGATPNLLLWGGLNGLYIVAENLINLYRPARPAAQKPAWQKLLSALLVMGFALLAAIPFRLSLPDSKVVLYRLAFAWDGPLPDLRPLLIFGLSLLLDWLQYRSNDEFIFMKWPRWGQATGAALVILAVVIVNQLQNTPAMFVYP